MSIFSRKFLPSFVLATIVVIGAIFFGEIAAFAKNTNQIEMPMTMFVHCSADDQNIQTSAPINNTFMPCCVERHDNSGTVVPAPMQERVKLMQSLMSQQVQCAASAVGQKIYPSSPSPPPEAENISSTVKIE